MSSRSINLRSVDLGKFDAESDRNILNYFVETGIVDKILDGSDLVLGRKGSGKTAIFLYLLSKYQERTIKLDLDGYFFDVHKQIVDERQSKYSQYVPSWKLVIYFSIVSKLKDEMAPNQRAKYKSIIDLIPSIDRKGLIGKILNWVGLGKPKGVSLPVVPGQPFGEVHYDLPPNNGGIDFNVLIEELRGMVGPLLRKKPVSVLVDQIDKDWDGSEQSKNFIRGLLIASKEINNQFKGDGIAPVVVFLRTDLWDSIEFSDRSKLGRESVVLRWSDDDLIRVIEKRIQSSLDDDTVSWDMVFTDDIIRNRMKLKKYIISMTMGRPRDILAFCGRAIDEAISAGVDRVGKEQIKSCEWSYCDYLLDEIKDEMAGSDIYGHLESFLSQITYKTFTWKQWLESTSAIGMNEGEAERVLKVLLEASVLGVYSMGGSAGGSHADYKYKNPRVSLRDREKEKIQVHPAVAAAFNLKEKRKRGS